MKKELSPNKKYGAEKIRREGIKSIKTSKIVVPLEKAHFSEPVQKILESKAKSYNKDPKYPFIWTRIYELNKILEKEGIDEKVTWESILQHHFPKFMAHKINNGYRVMSRVDANKFIDEYFLYMPFIFHRLTRGNPETLFSAGFDPAIDVTYTKNDYSRFRCEAEIKREIIDIISNVSIIEVE